MKETEKRRPDTPYSTLVSEIRKKSKIKNILACTDAASVIFHGVIFFSSAYALFMFDLYLTAKFLLACGVSFALFSFVRARINAPRPYEIYFFGEDMTSDSKDFENASSGNSFPSRHAFSSFLISVLTLSVCLRFSLLSQNVMWIFIFAPFISLAGSVSRVLLGYHFPRDAIAGAAIGTSSALISVLLF